MAFLTSLNLPPVPSLLTAVDSDEDSFIVLYKDEETNSVREEMSNPIENDTKEPPNDDSDIEKLIADLSLEKFLQIIEQNTLLKERLTENNKVMNAQCEKAAAWKEYQLEAERKKELFESLKKENCALNVMLDELKASKNSQNLEITVLKQIVGELTENEEEHIKNLEESNKEIEKFKEEHDKLTTELEQLKNDKHAQVEEIASLRQTVTELTQTNNGNVEKLKDIKQELEEVKLVREDEQKRLNEEIENLKSELAVANEKPTLEQLIQLKEQLDTAKVALMQLEQGKFIGDGQIVKLNTEILDLRMKLQDSLLQTDQIHALKAQLDVFKTDFELEKESKKTLKIENKKLVDEVENLRLCCRQLQEEINDAHEARIAPPPSVDDKFRCPVCGFEFSSQIGIMDLQSHIDKCLQASALLRNTVYL